MKQILWLTVVLGLMTSFGAAQVRPEEGGREFQVWTGGGHSVAGGTRDAPATVTEHLHRSGQLRVSLDEIPDRSLVVTYDAIEQIG